MGEYAKQAMSEESIELYGVDVYSNMQKSEICSLLMDNKFMKNQTITFYDDGSTNIDVSFTTKYTMIQHIAKTYITPVNITYYNIVWSCKKSKKVFDSLIKKASK